MCTAFVFIGQKSNDEEGRGIKSMPFQRAGNCPRYLVNDIPHYTKNELINEQSTRRLGMGIYLC